MSGLFAFLDNRAVSRCAPPSTGRARGDAALPAGGGMIWRAWRRRAVLVTAASPRGLRRDASAGRHVDRPGAAELGDRRVRVTRITLVGVVLASLAACAPPGPTPTTPAAAPATAAAPETVIATSGFGLPSPASATPTPLPTSPPAPPAPSPSASGPAASDPTLACGDSGVEFAASALEGPSRLTGVEGAIHALRTFLASGYPAMPTDGWRTVVDGTSSASFLAVGADSRWWFVTVAPSGGWQAREFGECHLAVRLPASLSYAEWRTDPQHPPQPAATSLTVLATELACASGQPPGSRLLAPVVVETERSVMITLVVRRRGNADCQANPEVRVVVRLGAPLGGRTLLDGTSVPARQR